jgi:hypothetical protein
MVALRHQREIAEMQFLSRKPLTVLGHLLRPREEPFCGGITSLNLEDYHEEQISVVDG